MTVSVRPARPGDAEGILRVQGDAWRAAYRGIFPDAILESRGREPGAADRRRQWLADGATDTLVAVEASEVAGFAVTGPPRGEEGGRFDRELWGIYVHPDRQRSGIGRLLMREAARAAAARGARSWFLWVLRDNPPARRFYERLGGRVVAERTDTVFGTAVAEAAYGWDDLGGLLGEGAPGGHPPSA